MDAAVDVTALMREIGREGAGGRGRARLRTFGAGGRGASGGGGCDRGRERGELLAANAADMEDAHAKGLTGAMLDRLELNEARVQGMVEGLRAIAAQANPVGQVMAAWDRPRGFTSAGYGHRSG